MKRDTDRRHLPTVYPLGKDSIEFTHESFDLHDSVDTSALASALSEPDTLIKVFDQLADFFSCERAQICLLERMTVKRENKNVPIILFRSTFNKNFNAFLKESEAVKFQNYRKTWSAPEGDESQRVLNGLHDFFHVVIDLQSLRVWINQGEASNAVKATLSFYPMAGHIKLSARDIVSSFLAKRPNDLFKGDCIYIHTGKTFKSIGIDDEFWTRLPFLLVRYSVHNSVPRYISYSTLGGVVEDVSFGNSSKNTAKTIAKYIETCQGLKVEAMEFMPATVIEMDQAARNATHGDFERFQSDFDDLARYLPDTHFAPLCSDYVTLLSSGHGADSNEEGIAAYVHLNDSYNEVYLSKIAAFFGYSKDHYPIVYSRSYLDSCYKAQCGGFLRTTIHELAHHLEHKAARGKYPLGDHGVSWCVMNDILCSIVTKEYCGSIVYFNNYHPDKKEIGGLLEDVMDYALTRHDLLNEDRSFTQQEIISIYHESMAQFEKLLISPN